MVEAGGWRAALVDAREEGYAFFDWLSAVDRTYDESAPGFDLVAHLLDAGTPRALAGILLVARVADGTAVASVTDVAAGDGCWSTAVSARGTSVRVPPEV